MIGRIFEQKSLMRAVGSDESQFVAVYGRRRIGKTYLVRETLGKQFCFEHSGIFGETFGGELSAFRDSLVDSGLKGCPELSNWTQAFRELRRVIVASRQKRKVDVFRDLVAHGKTVYLTMVTSAGLLRNKHSGIVQSEVTLDDLFRA